MERTSGVRAVGEKTASAPDYCSSPGQYYRCRMHFERQDDYLEYGGLESTPGVLELGREGLDKSHLKTYNGTTSANF